MIDTKKSRRNAPYTDFIVEEVEYDALSEADKERITNEEDSSFFIIRAVQDRPAGFCVRMTLLLFSSELKFLKTYTKQLYCYWDKSRSRIQPGTKEIEYRELKEGTERVLVQRRNRRASNNVAATNIKIFL